MFNSKCRIHLVCTIVVVLLFGTCNVAIAEDMTAELRGGITLSYSTEEVFSMNFHSENGFNGGIFFDTTPGEVRDRDTSNYGRTKLDGTERDLYGIDIGYSIRVLRLLRLGIEVSVGYETEYSKYSDYRFTEGYYLVEEKSDVVVGAGANAGILITKRLEITGGYNSLKGIVFGLGYVW